MPLLTFSATPRDTWDDLFDLARAADDAGIDRVAVSDHVVFGEDLDAYSRPGSGGIAGGRQPTGPDGEWLEPLTVLAMVGARTHRVRLSTGILLAALRRPAVLAKAAATVDVLTGGRLDLGVGVGWQREEYEAAGLSYEGRGALLDTTLAVCRALWRERAASYDSEHLHFERIHMMPKPLQEGGVPIWVSGTVNQRVLQRIVTFGDGWIPWGPDIANIRTSLPRVHQALADAGREPASLQVTTTLAMVMDGDVVDAAQTFAPVPELRKAGVTDFRLRPPAVTGYDAAMEWLQPLVQAFREVAAD